MKPAVGDGLTGQSHPVRQLQPFSTGTANDKASRAIRSASSLETLPPITAQPA